MAAWATVAALPAPADAGDGAEVYLNRNIEVDGLLARLENPPPSTSALEILDLTDEIILRLGLAGTALHLWPDGGAREAARELRARLRALPPELLGPLAERSAPQGHGPPANPEDLEADLADIVANHPFSPLAPDASSKLARTAFEKGDFDAALRHLFEAADCKGFRKGPDAMLAALCYELLGWRSRASHVALAAGLEKKQASLFTRPKEPRLLPADGGYVPVRGARFSFGPSGEADSRSAAMSSAWCIPRVSGGAFLAAFPRGIECLDAATGAVRWRFPEKPGLFARGRTRNLSLEPAVHDGRILVSFATFLAAFNEASGKMLWHFGSSDFLPPPPGLDNGVPPGLPVPAAISAPCAALDGFAAVAVSAKGALESYLLFFEPDGRVRWSLFLSSCSRELGMGAAPLPGLAVRGNEAFAVTGAGSVVAVDLRGPLFLWGRVLDPLPASAFSLLDARPGPRRSYSPVCAGPALYCLPAETGFLYALDRVTGEIAWKKPMAAGASIAGAQSDLLALVSGKEALGVDRWSGKIAWKTDLPAEVQGAGALSQGRMHVPVKTGILTLSLVDGSKLAMLDGLPGDGPLNLAYTGDSLAGCSAGEVMLFPDGSFAGGPLSFSAAASTGSFDQAARIAQELGEGEPPAFDLAAACSNAAREGDLVSAGALLSLLLSKHPAAFPDIARARIALGAAETAAGRRSAGLDRLADAAGMQGAVVEAGGVPWPAPALAYSAMIAALSEPGAAAERERAAEAAFASLGSPVDAGRARSFMTRFAFTKKADALLPALSDKDLAGLWPEWWLRGVEALPADTSLLESLAARLRKVSVEGSDLVHLALGRPGPREEREQAPALAGWPLSSLRFMPAAFGESFAVFPRALPSGPRAPRAFSGGSSFVQRLDPRTGGILWRKALGSWRGNAATAGETLITASSNGVTALDVSTGAVMWSAPLDDAEAATISTPGFAGDFELVPGRSAVAAVFGNGKAAGFDLARGERLWSASLPGAAPRALTQDPKTGEASVFFSNGRICRLDPDAGPSVEEPLLFDGTVAPAGAGRFLSILSRGASTVASLRLSSTGEKVWESRLGEGRYAFAAVDLPSGVAAFFPGPGSPFPWQIACLSLADGSPRSSFAVNQANPWGAAFDGMLFAAFSKTTLQAFDLAAGRISWSATIGGRGMTPKALICSAGAVAVGLEDGGFKVFSSVTGTELCAAAVEKGRVESMQRLGAGFLVFSERGSSFFGPPLSPRELAAFREVIPGERDRFLFDRAAKPWAGAEALERAISSSDTVGFSAADPGYLALRGAVENAAFLEKPRALARRFSGTVDPDTLFEEAWSEEDAVALRAGALRFIHEGRAEHATHGEADLSARLFLGWDEKALHLAVDVIDDRPVPHDQDSLTWSGDVVILAVDRLCDGGFGSRSLDDTIFWAFRPRQKEPEENPEKDEEPDKRKDLGQLKIRDRKGGGGAVYRFSLPWEEFFNVTLRNIGRRDRLIRPRPGVRFGLNILVVDDDGPGARKYLALSPGLLLKENKWDLGRGGGWPELWTAVELR